jgi:hypothetical protein
MKTINVVLSLACVALFGLLMVQLTGSAHVGF